MPTALKMVYGLSKSVVIFEAAITALRHNRTRGSMLVQYLIRFCHLHLALIELKQHWCFCAKLDLFTRAVASSRIEVIMIKLTWITCKTILCSISPQYWCRNSTWMFIDHLPLIFDQDCSVCRLFSAQTTLHFLGFAKYTVYWFSPTTWLKEL